MAILDGQNYFSDLAAGDAPTAVADNASAYVIDQQGQGSIFSEGGGAYIGMFLKAFVSTALVSGGGGTMQIVLQDSPDNVTYTDRMLGTATAAATAVAGYELAGLRIPQKLARYLRVVYRIGTAVFTAGRIVCFLTKDQDVFDLTQRNATTRVSAPTGALDESVANGVLAS